MDRDLRDPKVLGETFLNELFVLDAQIADEARRAGFPVEKHHVSHRDCVLYAATLAANRDIPNCSPAPPPDEQGGHRRLT